MEKYLKIHWSIRLILGIVQFLLILGISITLYLHIFYSEILSLLEIVDERLSRNINNLSILYPIINILIGISGILLIYKLFQYKRWAVITILIFIGLPLSISSVGFIGMILIDEFTHYFIDSSAGGAIGYDEIFIFILFIIITCIILLSLIKLIQLYRNIKNIENTNTRLLRNTKPKFINLFLISISPLILLGLFMRGFYNPVIPLEVPDGYFKIEGFDLDNPTYTDPKICKNIDDGLKIINENIRYTNTGDTSTGVILAKKVMFSESDMSIKYNINLKEGGNYNFLQKSMTEIQKEKPEEYKIMIKKQEEVEQKRSELQKYIKNYPNEWKKDLITLRSQLTNESVIEVQKLTNSLPQTINCSIRNDKNIESEFFPSQVQYLVLSRIYDAAIQLALLENNRGDAIDILRSFHDFNTKYNNGITSLKRGMISITTIQNEFGSIESLVKVGGKEEIAKIQEIYKTPYNVQKNKINAWKGEYYFIEHVLTGRGQSLKEVSFPCLFNGEDMLNRGIILGYAGVIASTEDDTIMKHRIHENQILNKNNFSTPTEQAMLEKGIFSGTNYNIFFGILYNPIGKILLDTFIPSVTGYNQQYGDIIFYQDYIRHDLLGIKDEVQKS